MSHNNLILQTDSYKASHFLQYPPGTEKVFSYVESRGGPDDSTVFFGLQAIIQEYLAKPISTADIDEAEAFFTAHGLPFNRKDWEYIVTEYDGCLPLEIRALPEGTVVPVHTPLFTVVNTDPKLPWLTSYVETLLLRVWYPTTVATISKRVRNTIERYLNATSDNPEAELPFKLHDFGARGVSSEESAALGGMAHLVNFQGSDTIAGILAAKKYYGEPMAGFSIPASEHSTITSWGRDCESDAYENMIRMFSKPGSIYACVADSYDLFNAVEHKFGGELRELIIEKGGTLVIRPDSGDPVKMVLKTLELLEKQFGCSVNSKGFKVLNHVRVIQGDGVNPDSIGDILYAMWVSEFSATNIAFGMGGALLQKCDRDTFKFAYKTSAAKVAGAWRDVYKDPVTDPGKRSKRGLMTVMRETTTGSLHTVRLDDAGIPQMLTNGKQHFEGAMSTVYFHGVVRRETFQAIRDRAAQAKML